MKDKYAGILPLYLEDKLEPIINQLTFHILIIVSI
jgi:hypothetical protein